MATTTTTMTTATTATVGRARRVAESARRSSSPSRVADGPTGEEDGTARLVPALAGAGARHAAAILRRAAAAEASRPAGVVPGVDDAAGARRGAATRSAHRRRG